MVNKPSNKKNERNLRGLIVLFVFSLLILIFLSALHVFAQNNSNVGKLVRSNTKFALDLYKQIESEDGNIFFSPYSVSTALALTYGGARGETAKQMAKTLHLLLEDEELHSAFSDIQAKLNAIQQKENIQLHIANSLWPQDKYPFLEEYLDLARNSYQTEISPVDYVKDAKAAKLKINTWVEGKTNNKILDMIPDNILLPPQTTLVLVNAIYFKGDWATQFEKSDTIKMPFFLNESESIEVPIMQQTNNFNYGENDILQALEMPYVGKELSMVIVLPREIYGIKRLEELITINNLEELTESLSEELIDVYLPKFRTTFQFDLKKVLKVMGMKDAFDMTKSDLSGMDGTKLLYIGYAIHKAFVDVNEEGTEAAAATAGGCFPSGTEILTVNGPRNIETVEPGTQIYGCELATAEWIITRISGRQSFQYEGDMITIQADDISIQATGNHPFYVLHGDSLVSRPQPHDVPKEERGTTEHGRWVEARDLRIGDVLKDRNGEGLIITGLSDRHQKTKVYNLDVEGCHNYVVHQKGLLVHNKMGAKPEIVLFQADHPFLFLIRDNLTENILFMGRISNPIE